MVTSILLIRVFVFSLVLMCGSTGVVLAAPDIPALMLLSGQISPSLTLPPVSPAATDRVLAFGRADGQLIGSGQLTDRGDYSILIARTMSFNGMQVVIELQHGLKRYALLLPGGEAASLRFSGRLLPDNTVLDLRIGQQTATLSPGEDRNPQAQRLSLRTDLPCTVDADVNEDGVCDAADVQILQRYGGGVSRTIGRP